MSDYNEPTEEELEQTQEEKDEDDARDCVMRFVAREYLRWDGKALVPMGKPKELRSYRFVVGQ